MNRMNEHSNKVKQGKKETAKYLIDLHELELAKTNIEVVTPAEKADHLDGFYSYKAEGTKEITFITATPNGLEIDGYINLEIHSLMILTKIVEHMRTIKSIV